MARHGIHRRRPNNTGAAPARCTHALMVTGRYAMAGNMPRTLLRCGPRWDLVVQNPTWMARRKRNNTCRSHWYQGCGWRQETSVLGFRASLADSLFGWWSERGRCEECHMSQRVLVTREMIRRKMLPSWALCDLPPLRVLPVREGSTGLMRESIRR